MPARDIGGSIDILILPLSRKVKSRSIMSVVPLCMSVDNSTNVSPDDSEPRLDHISRPKDRTVVFSIISLCHSEYAN